MQTFVDRALRSTIGRRSTVRGIAIVIAATLAVAAAPSDGQRSNADLGRSVAATCSNCHGTNGVSVGEVASLAGRQKAEIVRKMQDFKAGRLPGTVMPQLAKGFSDEQIDLAAAWFAAQTAK
jgi:cytochrome subunit of sulfide dehydrogenase